MKLFVTVTLFGLILVANGIAAAPSWNFNDPAEIATWTAINQCKLTVANGVLKTESTGTDPYFFPGGEWNKVSYEPFSGATYKTIYMRLKVNETTDWQVYYVTKENTAWGEVQQQTFKVEAKANLTNVEFLMERGDWQKNNITRFRIDPGTKAGIIAEIDYISLENLAATAVDGKGKLPVLWSTLKH